MTARVPFFVPMFNPIARGLLRLGIRLGPNALLTVRGRKSGQPRTTPIALVQIDGRRWISSPFGDVNWVRNLRSAGGGSLSLGRRNEAVTAIELTPDQAEAFFTDVLRPYVSRVPLGRLVIGSMLGASDILEDPAGAARRHPVFELVANVSTAAGAAAGRQAG